MTAPRQPIMILDHAPIAPMALRHRDAARMLGVSEGQLRKWVEARTVHAPYVVSAGVVLFDARTLAEDWERMKLQAREGGANEWDEVLNGGGA